MTGRSWRRVADDDSVRVSPVSFRLIDDVTGRAPLAPVTVALDRLDFPGNSWTALDVQPIITRTGMVAFPGLESRRLVAGLPPRRYRIRVSSALYRPLYRQLADSVEFQTQPDDDAAANPILPQDIVLLPSVSYPYPTHVRTVRGEVRDRGSRVVPDVVVSSQVQAGQTLRTEQTLTDDRGAFALALRWVPTGGVTTVIATDRRTQRAGSRLVAVPADLSHHQLITIV